MIFLDDQFFRCHGYEKLSESSLAYLPRKSLRTMVSISPGFQSEWDEGFLQVVSASITLDNSVGEELPFLDVEALFSNLEMNSSNLSSFIASSGGIKPRSVIFSFQEHKSDGRTGVGRSSCHGGSLGCDIELVDHFIPVNSGRLVTFFLPALNIHPEQQSCPCRPGALRVSCREASRAKPGRDPIAGGLQLPASPRIIRGPSKAESALRVPSSESSFPPSSLLASTSPVGSKGRQ